MPSRVPFQPTDCAPGAELRREDRRDVGAGALDDTWTGAGCRA